MEKSYLESMPDEKGFFGTYGGAFIPPELEKLFADINASYDEISKSLNYEIPAI